MRKYYRGIRLKWKEKTINYVLGYFNTPGFDGGWRVPKYAARALNKMMSEDKLSVSIHIA